MIIVLLVLVLDICLFGYLGDLLRFDFALIGLISCLYIVICYWCYCWMCKVLILFVLWLFRFCYCCICLDFYIVWLRFGLFRWLVCWFYLMCFSWLLMLFDCLFLFVCLLCLFCSAAGFINFSICFVLAVFFGVFYLKFCLL